MIVRNLGLMLSAFFMMNLGSAFAADVYIKDVQFSEEFKLKLEKDYGASEGKYLKNYLSKALATELKRNGHTLVPRGQADVKITPIIENAKPNKPTYLERRRRSGLSYHHSFGIGGAKVKFKIDDSRSTTYVGHKWYESNIEYARHSSTWSDARRSFRQGSRKAAKRL